MVVFNIGAIAELLLSLGLYWLIALVAPGLESPGGLTLGDATTSGLVLTGVLFGITGLSEFAGLRGRLFWLPTHGFAGLLLGTKLSQRIGVAGWVIALGLAAAVIGVSWWRRRAGDETSAADSHRALVAADEAVSRGETELAWQALDLAYRSGDQPTAADAMHNREVLQRIHRLTPPQHQAFVGSAVASLDAAYAQVEGGVDPRTVDLSSRWVIRAVLEAKGEVPPKAYATASARP